MSEIVNVSKGCVVGAVASVCGCCNRLLATISRFFRPSSASKCARKALILITSVVVVVHSPLDHFPGTHRTLPIEHLSMCSAARSGQLTASHGQENECWPSERLGTVESKLSGKGWKEAAKYLTHSSNGTWGADVSTFASIDSRSMCVGAYLLVCTAFYLFVVRV